MFVVYIRSNSAYSIPDNELFYKHRKYIFDSLGFFRTFEAAKKWLIKNGKKIDEQFYDRHLEGCVFLIEERNNYKPDEDEMEDYMILADNPPINFLAVFSKESYLMVMDEHTLMHKHDWASIFPDYIHYLRNGKLEKVGITREYFDKLNENYFPEFKQKNLTEYLEGYSKNKIPIW